ncbi:MAG TPA: CHAT domain-containing protein [Steroidobacteraceae bacterium]|nr:CHAT domain-containing protein [Steroidobacteraceae bacterium]
MRRPTLTGWRAVVVATALLLLVGSAHAVQLPALCATAAAPLDLKTPLPELRRQVEQKAETDPKTTVAIMCMAIPRVEREYGAQSPELAWWAASLTMPMIAYLNQFAEAEPLLKFAQPILERRYGRDAAEVADIHVAYAWIYQREGRNAESERAWERALRIRERFPGDHKIELQKILVGLALVRVGQGEFPQARAALQREHGILAEQNQLVSEAGAAVENVYTNLSLREEKFLEAKAHAERQIEIEKQLSAGIGQFVPAYVLLGQILERLGDYAGSEAASREAIRLAETDRGGPLQRHQLTALTQLGVLLDARGRPREALSVAEQAVQLGESTLGADAPGLVKPLQSLADVHRDLGQLPEAWHLYEHIGRIVAKSPSDVELPTRVTYYRGLAGLQLDLGNVDEAVTALDAGLAATRAEPALVLQRGYLLETLAQASARRADPQSRARYTEALTLFGSRLPDSHPTVLRVVNELCGLDVREHAASADRECSEVRSRLASARDVDPALRAAVYDNLSELSRARGDSDHAVALAVSAVSAAEGLGTPDPLARSYFIAARALNAQGRTALAIFFGKRAIAQIQRQRQYFSGEDERLDRGFLLDKIAMYRTVADWLMESGRIDEGLEVLQLLKAQELYDFTSRAAVWDVPGSGPALNDRERTLDSRYSAVLPADAAAGAEIDRLRRLQQQSRITARERKRLDELLQHAQQAEGARARRIQAFIASNAQPGSAPSTSSRIDAKRLERALTHAPADSVIAIYVLTDQRLRLLIATRQTQREIRVSLNAHDLQRRIGRFLDLIGQRAPIDASARSLYDTLARPLDEAARQERVTHLLLWLDGPLRYVPFGALEAPDGSYLADRYAIEMLTGTGMPLSQTAAAASSISESRTLRTSYAPEKSGGESSLRVLGFGVTQAVAGFQPLPGMADELCYVVHGPIAGLMTHSAACRGNDAGDGALPGEGFADRAFTAQRFAISLQAPHSYKVLHVGTHFSLRPGNAMRSFLVLGDGSRLMLDRLAGLDFTGLDLVTLSACQTAMGGGRTDDGREIEGLSAIVQQRGAKQVIASLWRVEDESTAQLMHGMYLALAAHRTDVAGALQQAQQRLRAQVSAGRHPYAHPYYWAGFVVSSRELPLEGPIVH